MNKNRPLIIFGSILLVLFLAVLFFPTHLKTHDLPSLPKSDKEIIMEKAEYKDLKESEEDGYTRYQSVYTGENDYEGIIYHVYKSERAAKKALKGYKKIFYPDRFTEGDNYIEGEEKDVCDAAVTRMIYRSGKMLIFVEASYADFYDSERIDEITMLNNHYREIYEKCKAFVFANY